MYAPLAAIASAGRGFIEGKREAQDDLFKQYDMQGLEALGRAFQMAPMEAPARGPIPPMPGQPSVAAAGGPPQMQPPGANQPSPLDTAQWPAGPIGAPGGAPPVSAPGMPPPQGAGTAPPVASTPAGGAPSPGGMPQFDLQTLATRIRQANPNLPPQAMFMALNRAVPLLNVQGRMELAQLRQQMQQQMLEYRRDALDTRERLGTRRLDIQEDEAGRRKEQGGRRLDIQEKGQEQRGRQFDAREERMREQFQTNQERLRDNAARRFEDLDRRFGEMQKRRLSLEERTSLARELRTIESQERAAHNATMEQIQAGFLTGAEKERITKESQARLERTLSKIEDYRKNLRGGGADPNAPKGQDRVPSGGSWVDQPDGTKIWVPGQ